ncbi:zinc finger and BTB domain-containing protein 47 [Drosophila ficusphila]|uniref:zinc finger and BTB domain-containing protein 47 n=1 Tax=Drosophila ficusphila TaxID=30025 RepID=UPI0007E6C92F|nr:zinc finger and BTB domain-containing protein 47 [Drosophila ficusphila]
MRSLLSHRYDNKREEFYERYEEARKRHPNLPLYERPLEPTKLQVFNASSRRFQSYRQFSNLSREQLESDSWLSSNQLSIVLRSEIEQITGTPTMPRYDPSTATHEFSHNGKPRRGRPPSAATVAKSISDFAVQVGGLPVPVPVFDSDESGESQEEEEEEETGESKESEEEESGVSKEEESGESKESEEEEITIDLDFDDPELKLEPEPEIEYTLAKFQSIQEVTKKNKPVEKKSKKNLMFENEENKFVDENKPPLGTYPCPKPNCQQVFKGRRGLYKHQRESGHHSWSHKCVECGQVFRTAGFKRMHSNKACERNLHKLRSSKPNEFKQLVLGTIQK